MGSTKQEKSEIRAILIDENTLKFQTFGLLEAYSETKINFWPIWIKYWMLFVCHFLLICAWGLSFYIICIWTGKSSPQWCFICTLLLAANLNFVNLNFAENGPAWESLKVEKKNIHKICKFPSCTFHTLLCVCCLGWWRKSSAPFFSQLRENLISKKWKRW